jgi:hypothetical protein
MGVSLGAIGRTTRAAFRVRAAFCVAALIAVTGCGGDDSSPDGTTNEIPGAGVTSEEEAQAPEEIGVPVGTATGDPCDVTDVEAAEALVPIFDCDPRTEKIVSEGLSCKGPTRTGVGGILECDSSRTCGGSSHWARVGKRWPCELGKPQPSPGITPPPTGEGDPCVPGQPVPPGFKCE